MPENDPIIEALKLIKLNARYPHQPLLDTIYGPQAADLRAKVASILQGSPIKKSHKDAQYGKLKAALCSALNCNSNSLLSCTAAVEHEFERIALHRLRTEMRPAGSTVPGALMPLG